MKNFLLFFTVLVCSCCLHAQNRKGAFYLTPGCDRHELYFAVLSRYDFSAAKDVQQKVLDELPELNSKLGAYDFNISKGIEIPEQNLLQMEQNAIKYSGDASAVRKLRNIFKIDIDEPTNDRLYELAALLETVAGVEYASLMPLQALVPPPADIAPPTTDLQMMQNYLDDSAVNMKFAWSKGLKGSGITVRDIEYGYSKTHEDIMDLKTAVATGMDIGPLTPLSYKEHGTAVFGVVGAPANGYGVTGMTPDIKEMILYPEQTSAGYSRTKAVTNCIAESKPGDVIIYEMQTFGASMSASSYVPAEYNNIIWDLTKSATDAGLTIVAAAGNGNQNLDSSVYADYKARGNSGAIIVGAGTPNTFRNRENFSTYGSRVDVQGWGSKVMTTGYGAYLKVGGDTNQTYTLFSGTSSATPIVASCVAALQSYYYSSTKRYLPSWKMKELLVASGSPQGDVSKGKIGPLPNMERAYKQLKDSIDKLLLTEQEYSVDEACILFPNPAAESIHIITPAYLGEARLQLNIVNTSGQLVHQSPISRQADVILKDYPKGHYFVQIWKDTRLLHSARFIKN